MNYESNSSPSRVSPEVIAEFEARLQAVRKSLELTLPAKHRPAALKAVAETQAIWAEFFKLTRG
jgi:hypothetical protein